MNVVKTDIKLYCKYGIDELWGYRVFLIPPTGHDPQSYNKRYANLANDAMFTFFRDRDVVKNLCDHIFKPQDGMSCYVAQPCDTAVDSIRQHYKIKRTADTGDFNVLSAGTHTWTSPVDIYAHYDVGIYADKINKIAVLDCRRTDWSQKIFRFSADETREIESYFVQLTGKNVCLRYIGHDGLRDFDDVSPVHRGVLDGTTTKPVVFIDDLNFDNGNKLDVETLMLVLSTLKAIPNNKNYQNALTELGALSQYNWRDYPHTLKLMRDNAYYARQNVYSNMIANYNVSRFPKAIQPLLRSIEMIPESEQSEEDWNMEKALVEALLGGVVRFTTRDVLNDKLNKAGLTGADFNKFFDTVVKITPKEFEKRESDN